MKRRVQPTQHAIFDFVRVSSEHGADVAQAASRRFQNNPHSLPVSRETIARFASIRTSTPKIATVSSSSIPLQEQHSLPGFQNTPPQKEHVLFTPDLFGRNPTLVPMISRFARPVKYTVFGGEVIFKRKGSRKTFSSKILRDGEKRYVLTNWGKKYWVTAGNELLMA